MGGGSASWNDVLALPELKVPMKDRPAAAACLNTYFSSPPSDPPVARTPPPISKAALIRLLNLCPCLFNQIDIASTARAVVHFCEISLGVPVSSATVYQAFLLQHPGKGPPLSPPPLKPCKDGGKIMEMLCSEALAAAGIPAMTLGADKWPIWQMPGHVLLNEGPMSELQALGDLLVPCAPTNLVISVKSEVARERLLYSANSIEGIGFGFFKEPEEFWTDSRMALYKRMGFTAIYMPDQTHAAVMAKVTGRRSERHAVNINGTDLYRPFTAFGDDMRRVVGRSSAKL